MPRGRGKLRPLGNPFGAGYIGNIGGRMDKNLAETELRIKAELTAEIHKAKTETVKWVVGLLVAQTAALVALIKIL